MQELEILFYFPYFLDRPYMLLSIVAQLFK